MRRCSLVMCIIACGPSAQPVDPPDAPPPACFVNSDSPNMEMTCLIDATALCHFVTIVAADGGRRIEHDRSTTSSKFGGT
jgi:hypothetical protein